MCAKDQGELEAKRKEYSNSFQTLEGVWTVLRERSSPENPLTVSQICQYLALREWDPQRLPSSSTVSKMLRSQTLYGLSSFSFRLRCMTRVGGRLIPYEDWEELIEYGLCPRRNNRPRLYYLESLLSDSQWQMLTDLVSCCPFLTLPQADRMLTVLKRFFPACPPAPVHGVHRHGQENFVSIMDQVSIAIRQHRLIDLLCGDWTLELQEARWTPVLHPREQKWIRNFCPHTTFWSGGSYYILGVGERGLLHLRADLLCEVRLQDAVFPTQAAFALLECRDAGPLLSLGPRSPVRLRCPTSMLQEVQDCFGDRAVYATPRDGMMEVSMNVSPAGVKRFALQYCDSVEVLQPETLRHSVVESLTEALRRYSPYPADLLPGTC